MGLSMSFFTFMYLSFLLSFFQLTSSRQPLCHDNERIALLRFKESFLINKSASGYPSAYPKAARWNLAENSDCCSWEGVKCNEDTGYVVKLDLTSSYLYGSLNSAGNALFNLVHLQWLSLADNDFNDSKIPYGIKNLSNLSHLNLSWSLFSGQIPPEMLELSNLKSLDLSKNYQLQLHQPGLKILTEKLTNLKVLDLGSVNISSSLPHTLTNLSSLKFLSLRDCNLQGQIPPEMLQLFNLESLDLSDNWFLDLQQSGLKSLIEKLTNLKVLDLGSVNISSPLPKALTNLSSLKFLSLHNCNLQGKISSSLGDITNLNHLDLSRNNFGGKISSSLGTLTSLNYLDLSDNYFEGELVMGNLTSLEVFKMVGCNFSIQALSGLSNLSQLNYLDLSDNNILTPSSFLSCLGQYTKLTHLKYLNVRNCSLSGQIPSSFGNLTQLTELYMEENQLTGPIPLSLMKNKQISFLSLESNQVTGLIPYEIRNLTQLTYLDLSSNSLEGPIPSTIFELKNIMTLRLQSNNLSGTVDLGILLRQFEHLEELMLSSNNLSVISKTSVNSSRHPLMFLGLSSCNLIELPNFLQNQKQLYMLDLSSNKLSGQIPKWFLDPTTMVGLENLNLSKNLLTGFEQHPIVFPWTELLSLDLRFNKLQGLLPTPPRSTNHYLISNNMLNGGIPTQICNLKSLYIVDLSNNNLSGVIPQCLANFNSDLSILALRSNKFRGSIPQTFMNGTSLRMIDLSNNSLKGRIPRSLVNCTKLEFLHLGSNQINDVFPSWLGTLPKLKVLILKSNRLHGVIKEPMINSEFSKLQVIDLSHNMFRGDLPTKYFQCWNAMKVANEKRLTYMTNELRLTSPYYTNAFSEFLDYAYSMTISNKGSELNYEKIPNMFTSILLSGNKFEGEIPASIVSLVGLKSLNLSQNNLDGHIPSSLGNLTALESLDLSNNRLSGEIPQQLANITYLAVFNVSHNHLIGPIPKGKQFETFENSSYDGNPGLCGKPLSKMCENFETPKNEDEEVESPFVIDWKIVVIGLASGLIVGVVLGQELYTRQHEWFVKTFGILMNRERRCIN